MASLPLGALAATALLEASKLPMGKPLTMTTPQQIQGISETKGHQWMTGGRLTKYQAILLYSPDTVLKICQTLNLASLIPGPGHAITFEHD